MCRRLSMGTALCRLGFCVIAVVVAGLALYPHLQLPEPQLTRGFTDKIYHSAGCALLVLLAARGWSLKISLVIMSLPLSPGLELIQGVIPGRGVHISDMIANFLGIATALLLLGWLDRPKETVS